MDARVTLDRSNSEHAHIAERLATTWIAWFATTRRDGRPQIVPVWFGWTGNAVVVFSAPATAKVGHVRRTPACSLGIETADGGNDAILIDATAEIASDEHPDVAAAAEVFCRKYAGSFGDGGFAEWRRFFAQPIVLHPARIAAWRKPAGELRYTLITP